VAILTKVVLTKFATKQMNKIPFNIKESLRYWIEAVQYVGIMEVRKSSGYHDEPLKGDRVGQRSVRLNKSYRVIYLEVNNEIEILIIEVNKHGY
jgi:proteic killer suppression protein